MQIRIAEIAPDEIDVLRELVIELHQQEVAVQPTLAGAPARSDADYWRIYRERFAGWIEQGGGFCVAAYAESTDGADVSGADSGAINAEPAIGYVFIVEKEGNIAYETGEPLGYVEEIAVLQQHRGSGVGRELMRVAAERMAERGIEYFSLSTVPGNQAARDFYASLGMQIEAIKMLGRTSG